MKLLTLEHSKTAYQADVVFYGVAVALLATLLLLDAPPAHWMRLSACVLIGAAAMKVLADLPKIDGNPFVIAGEAKGKPRSDLKRPWKRITDHAGLNVDAEGNRRLHAPYAGSGGQAADGDRRILRQRHGRG